MTAPDCGLNRQVTTVEAARGDTLVLGETDCPLGSVTRLERYRGRGRRTGRGALIGGIAGGTTGLTLMALWVHDCCCFIDCGCSDNEAGRIIGGAAVGSLVGALLGAGIGAFITTELWEEVPLDRLRVSVTPLHDGLTVGLSVRF